MDIRSVMVVIVVMVMIIVMTVITAIWLSRLWLLITAWLSFLSWMSLLLWYCKSWEDLSGYMHFRIDMCWVVVKSKFLSQIVCFMMNVLLSLLFIIVWNLYSTWYKVPCLIYIILDILLFIYIIILLFLPYKKNA